MPYHYCYLTPKAETRESPIAGKGTFATTFIPQGELVAAFGGRILNDREWQKLSPWLGSLFLTIDDDLFIGPPTEENVGDGDFINHSCEPNTGIQGQIFLVAMRDIYCDEEICFDYAMVVSEKDFSLKCACGLKECRQILTGEDWRNPHLQQKYKGYFSSYLQTKLNALKN